MRNDADIHQPSTIDKVAGLIQHAKCIVVLTGAGMSKESGIPTFRDADTGLWSHYDPQQFATPRAWRKDKALVMGWYCWRAANNHRAQPHSGHRALVALEQRAEQFTLITQNIDHLHERAGSQNVIHLHGRIDTLRCFACHRPGGTLHVPDDALENPKLRVEPSRCTHCSGYLRPDVVWFGEMLPVEPWRNAMLALRECDLMLEVYPAAGMPDMAIRRGAPVVEINPVPEREGVEGWISMQRPASELTWLVMV